MALIEFYDGVKPGILSTVKSDAVPRPGEFVSIRKKTWEVVRVTWAVDYSDSDTPAGRTLRANVEMTAVK